MIKFLTNPIFSTILCTFIILLSLYMSLTQCDSGWIASSGAMISLFGILMTTRVILRHKTQQNIFESQNLVISSLPSLPSEGVDNLENNKKIKEQEQENKEKIKDIQSQQFGVWFLIIGTIIWAYGDRIFSLFCDCCK